MVVIALQLYWALFCFAKAVESCWVFVLHRVYHSAGPTEGLKNQNGHPSFLPPFQTRPLQFSGLPAAP